MTRAMHVLAALFDPRWLDGWTPKMGPAARSGVRALAQWGAHHVELRAFLVMGLALIVFSRVIGRSLRVAIEVLIALVLVGAATRLGWLTW